VIASVLAARVRDWTKPEPRSYRDIIGSPDGWSPHSRTIDEIKSTWVKESTFLESAKFDSYCRQSLFYAHKGMFDADRIRLHVLFVCGNHRPIFPHARTFILKPSRAEKQQNFETLYQHGVDMGLLRAA
jgi:hypothetical protein